jgi:hypothetical protein
MSTGADCRFEEREPGRWWYAIQQYPYGETEDYDTHGPFVGQEAAERHLDANYGNPGGWSETTYAQLQERAAEKALRAKWKNVKVRLLRDVDARAHGKPHTLRAGTVMSVSEHSAEGLRLATAVRPGVYAHACVAEADVEIV